MKNTSQTAIVDFAINGHAPVTFATAQRVAESFDGFEVICVASYDPTMWIVKVPAGTKDYGRDVVDFLPRSYFIRFRLLPRKHSSSPDDEPK